MIIFDLIYETSAEIQYHVVPFSFIFLCAFDIRILINVALCSTTFDVNTVTFYLIKFHI